VNRNSPCVGIGAAQQPARKRFNLDRRAAAIFIARYLMVADE
jgi:hypothetical protein|tara:strand:- start:754 stop:879 length:126 start_codon:yes stop_codon:yes gene_type:complete